MTLVATDRKPNVAGKQIWIGDTVQVTDTSTDANGDLTTIKVIWGDGTVSTIAPGETATHVYSKGGDITIRLRAFDSKGLVTGVKRLIYVRKAPLT
jgi:PKD repeat protein